MSPLLVSGLIALVVAGVVFVILWKTVGWAWWLALIIGVVLGLILGAMLLFWVFPKFSAEPRSSAPPQAEETEVPVIEEAPTEAPLAEPLTQSSLNYDETNADALVPGQKQLIALYLRIPAPISQTQLEYAVSQIQTEAVAANAVTFQNSTLTLDQHQAWLVWCSDATQVDPPADVSLVHEITLLATNTVGRVWIQVPFAQGVPLRTDDTWKGCNSPTGFWSVAVH